MAQHSAWIQDPQAVLDYKIDWAASTNGSGPADWLASGETIGTYSVSASTGLTVDSSSLTDDDTSVTVWLSGGTVGKIYTVTCHIVTDASREDDRTITIKCEER